MHTQALRGVPARNCDAVKHSLPVQLDPRDVPSSSLLATSLVSHAAFFPSHSIPSQHYSLIFSSPILAAISFFFFFPLISIPILWNGTALHRALLSCATPFFLTATHPALFPHHFSFNSVHCVLKGLKEYWHPAKQQQLFMTQ